MNRPTQTQISNRVLDIKVEDVETVRLLGSGNSGNVWLAYVHDRELGIRSVYAAKKIRHENDFREGNTGRGSSELESLKNELEIYIRLQCHPNFPKLIGVVRDDRHFTIITEYVEGGDLRSFLRQKAAQTGMFVQQPVTDADYHENMTFKRNESQVRWLMRFDKPHAVGAVTTSILVYIALQIALTLKRLVMDLKILHRDAAARNVLITRDFVVKITDFGLARDLSYDKESQRDLPITALAPETLKTQKFTAQSEVWQFGVLLFEIFSLGMVEPYDDILAKSTTQRPAVKLQLYLQRGGRLSPPREMPEPIKRLMAKCFMENPRDRPTFDNITTTLRDLLRFMSPQLAAKIDSAMQCIVDGSFDNGDVVAVNFASSLDTPMVNTCSKNIPDDRQLLKPSQTWTDNATYEKSNGGRLIASNTSWRSNTIDIQLPRVASMASVARLSTNRHRQPLARKGSMKSFAVRVTIPTVLMLVILGTCLAVYCLVFNKNTDCFENLEKPKDCFENQEKPMDNFENQEKPTDCFEVYQANRSAKSGVYKIYSGKLDSFNVYCDMETDGGGWTVFQRRSSNNSHAFYNGTWENYKTGFGTNDKMDNFWLGLDHIHRLSTKDAVVALRIDLSGPQCTVKNSRPDRIQCDEEMVGQEWFGLWKKFWVDGETLNYSLHISQPGDGSLNSYWDHDSLMKMNNEQGFTTYDRDNDASLFNCAQMRQQGAWWYKDCECTGCRSPRRKVLKIALNGEYRGRFDYRKDKTGGIIWEYEGKDKTHDAVYQIVPTRTEMKLRRVM